VEFRFQTTSGASAALIDVRQDAALMLHDEHRDVDDVAARIWRKWRKWRRIWRKRRRVRTGERPAQHAADR
jgi:hypothetical protein